jgi:hypothetical protein
MPDFKQNNWNGYMMQVVPNGWIRDLMKVIPYFYGSICFDLEIITQKKKDVQKEKLEYEWGFYISGDDNKMVKLGRGTIDFANAKPYNHRRNKRGDITSIAKNKFRKIMAVDLEHVSIPRQYNLVMEFTDNAGTSSERMMMVDFTLLDRDRFALNIMSLVVGAFFGAIFGIVGSVLVFVFTEGN